MFDPKKLMEAMNQAMEMQKSMQRELASKTVQGTAIGDMVVVTMNGDFQVSQVVIDPKLLEKNDLPFLQDLIKSAFNDAVGKAREIVGEQVKSMTGKLGL